MPVIIQSIRSRANILTKRWADGVRTAGGGFENNSIVIANGLASVLVRKSYYAKIRYLSPLLGAGINAARVPLIDTVGAGTAINNNLTDADFSQATGLKGNGSNKYFNLNFGPGDLGSNGNGGVGYWSLIMGTASYRIGAIVSGAEQYNLYLDPATPRQVFYWGTAALHIDTDPSGPTNSHYYGQRTLAAITLYRSGASIAVASGTSDVPNINTLHDTSLLATSGQVPTDGTSGLGYATDGTMTDAEILDFHSVISSYLMKPTGRI